MVYYLGKDVKIYITTETDEAGVKIVLNEVEVVAGGDTDTHFAHKLNAAGCAAGSTGFEVSDLTGCDVGIGVTDEDISYVGRMNVLKAEIKRETTVSLTRKKTDDEWDLIYCGVVDTAHLWDAAVTDVGARWGVSHDGSSYLISNGLFAPVDHVDSSGEKTFGYRIHVRLKTGGQVLSIPGCTITGHTLSINGEGTTEETLEFMSYVTPLIGNVANTGAITTATL